MSLWLIGFVAGTIVVLLVATLLIGILVEARRIRELAAAASRLVEETDEHTRGVWALRDTTRVAEALLAGAEAIDDNSAAIVKAVHGKAQEKSAA